jgi:hypothetical protein
MPLLTLHTPSGSKSAPTAEWLTALVTTVYDGRPKHAGLGSLHDEKPATLAVTLGGRTLEQPMGVWLVLVLKRLTTLQREKACAAMRGDQVSSSALGLALPGAVGPRLSLEMPLVLEPVTGTLEQWVSAVLQAMGADDRAKVFNAVGVIGFDTPGHYVLHAEPPKGGLFGGQ